MSDIKTETETRPVVVGAADGLLFGYSQDHEPMIWREGEPAQTAQTGIDYPGGWWVDQFVFDVFWRNENGEEIRP